MCGIVGYIGKHEAVPIIIEGLKRLEYRGYDSAGLAVLRNDEIKTIKCKGKVRDLENKIKGSGFLDQITFGIGHTRWATHGVPNDVNAHPHISNSGELAIVHNGIIENYITIGETLISRGFKFETDTDTEVLINLIEYIKNSKHTSLMKATKLALNQITGAYAIAVFSKENPDQFIVAKNGSPLAVGIGDGEFYIASDTSPFLNYTRKVVYLEDDQIATIKLGENLKVKSVNNNRAIDSHIQQLKMDIQSAEKGEYKHFMLKEIYEQPKAVHDSLRGRLLADKELIKMRGVSACLEKFLKADRIIIIGCGTSWHSGLIAEYIFENLTGIPVEVEYASEFRYRNPIVTKRNVVIAISQSGETADTLAGVKLAKEKGALVFGICNVAGSSIVRETHVGAYTHAGMEIGVASTKAFTAQISVLSLIALKIAYEKGTIEQFHFHQLLVELDNIPAKIEKMLKTNTQVKYISGLYKDSKNFLYLGRGYNFPVALEGALKLKEISYIHAEGYPAAEMKHGPIALVDENMPIVVIAPKLSQYEKILSNTQEIKARRGRIIGIVSKGDDEISAIADHIIEIEDTLEVFLPLLAIIPLQLLSYHIADMRGCNVDQPRNLAKSVTVE